MKIEVTRAFSATGKVHSPGEVLDMPDAFAFELIGLGKAVAAKGKPESAPKPKKESKE